MDKKDEKRSARIQRAAYEAHVRGKRDLDRGDITGAFVNDQEADDLALSAMLLRMRGK